MKKGIFGKVFASQAVKLLATAVFVATAALVFAGCEQSTGGSGGTGTVTVSILFDEETGTDEQQNVLNILRTVHPEVDDTVFARFTATFEATSGGAAHAPVALSLGEPAPVTLAVGTYTVTVTGYTGTEGSYVAAAIGSAEGIVVTGGTNTEASILMAPNAEVAGKGSFKYTITAPAGAAGTLIIQKDGQQVGDSVELTGGNDPVTGTIDLDAGVYLVFVYLTNDDGDTAGLAEALHIYNGMESTLTEEYEGDDFKEPQQVTDYSLTSFFAAPSEGGTPVTSFGSASDQYTGTIQWKAGGSDFTDTAFAAGTVYTAVVTLQANPKFTLTGVKEDAFTHENATSHTNSANDGVVTLVFPATAGTGTGTQSIVIGFNYGEITVTGAGATIYKTGTPSTLNLEVQGYQNHVWYIDGDASDPKTGNPITINAADYSIQQHTASFTGKKDGILYSQSVSFTVEEGGDGTPESPLQITTVDELVAFRNRVTNDLEINLCAELKADLTLDSWTKIGNSKRNNLYKGTFDGNGHTLTLSNTEAMFYVLDCDAVVKNLNLHVTSSIAGVASINYGTISDVTVNGTISGSIAGGIVGENCYKNDSNGTRQYGRLYRCINKANVSGGNVGGIAGGFFGVMRYCGNEGTVTGSSYAGGLAGRPYSTPQLDEPVTVSISDSYNTGTVTSNATSPGGETLINAAGLLGGNWSIALKWTNGSFSVKNCFSYGTVSSRELTGNIIDTTSEVTGVAVSDYLSSTYTNIYWRTGAGGRLFPIEPNFLDPDLDPDYDVLKNMILSVFKEKSAEEFKSAALAAALNNGRTGNDPSDAATYAPWEYIEGNDYPTLKFERASASH